MTTGQKLALVGSVRPVPSRPAVMAALQPGGGSGDKVFPRTFAGAVYAIEHDAWPDVTIP